VGVRAELSASRPPAVARPWIAAIERLRQDARAWCSGRSWVWRAPILAYLGWAGVRHLRDPLYGSLFGGITLGIHELGHLILGPLGAWPGIAGGSLAQIAAPAAAAWILARQRDYFGIAVGAAWLAFSLFGLATYIGDARARELPLVALTPDPIHDWNWMLGRLGLLSADHALAFLCRAAAAVLWAGAMVLGSWLLWVMGSVRRARANLES